MGSVRYIVGHLSPHCAAVLSYTCSSSFFRIARPFPTDAHAQRIGQDVVDLAFIMDADGVLLELIHRKFTLDTEMPQAW